MHIILTHEQADFDAIAAELGAFLLNETAYPVLPRKMNRNVRAFLTLYGTELPFIEPRDLPQGSITQITLVDTQSLITLKGMGHATAVHVIDHHQVRPELPEKWTLTIERLGSCTTLFVELLREHNGVLSTTQASLLLLGIYEDTGSLTYASTTVRDVHAAAFLLEQGANLRIVAEYLNAPLSAEQRRLYDRLVSAIEPHHINGQNIVIAYANGEDISDEISGIAHKLRDLLDPDALFLVVSTSEGIRLVARSTSDHIDVSAVAAHFGGGGHERAAAALVKSPGSTLTSIYQEILALLPRFVRPSVTIDRIMSHHPRLLSPETPAQEAAQLMQRYGYEGYPVVKEGKVIGLLTRRAVDRAISHKLNLTALSLMEAGEVTVQSSDSLEHLQRVMTDTGWGQIPVIDPEDGRVIGIVTRTDLLKSITRISNTIPGKQNLASRLEAALPPARLAFLKLVAEQARELRLPIYIVGGFVRDLILDRPSFDFDIVVEGDAISLARALAARFGGRLTSHGRFGTAKWQCAEISEALLKLPTFPARSKREDIPETLDLISARTEFYEYPTALPTVERSGIKLDLHRRDFTINTMALRLDGRHYGDLYDYWGGYNDLRQGLVRVLHSLSFVDDPTRLLRAVRFEQRFNFRIETRTRELMDGAKELVKEVSGDRLRHELSLILLEKRAAAMLSRLDELGLLTSIHPELAWDERLSEPLNGVITGEIDPAWGLPDKLGTLPLRQALGFLIWLAHVPVDSIRAISDRLHFQRPLQIALEEASHLLKELPGMRGASPSKIVARLDGVSLVVLYALCQLTGSSEIQGMLESYARILRHIHPYTTGDQLREMGMPPGPAYRGILEQLRAAWLDGTITSIEEEKNFLHEYLQKTREAEEKKPE